MAIRTKNLILSNSDVDSVWGFQFYLGLPPDTLRGQDEKISSPFASDTNPSFSIYKRKDDPTGPYRWHCLSTGKKGSIVDLVALLKSPDPEKPLGKQAALKIIQKDFYDFLEGNVGYVPVKQLLNTKGRVTYWELRNWTKEDYDWWREFGISANTLNFYNVAPLGEWHMHKIKNGEEKNMVFNNSRAYAYLTKTGELGKIYQPGQTSKYIKVLQNWLQGFDQLTYTKNELLIMAGLKDGMAFIELGFEDFEFIAVDGEGILLPKEIVEFLKTKYKRIRVLFDNDDAGRLASAKWKKEYDVESVFLNMSKDVAASIMDYNQPLVKIELIPLL